MKKNVLMNPETNLVLPQVEKDFYKQEETQPYARVYCDQDTEEWRYETYGLNAAKERVMLSSEAFNDKGEAHGQAVYYSPEENGRINTSWFKGEKHGKEVEFNNEERAERFYNKGILIGDEKKFEKDSEGFFQEIARVTHTTSDENTPAAFPILQHKNYAAPMIDSTIKVDQTIEQQELLPSETGSQNAPGSIVENTPSIVENQTATPTSQLGNQTASLEQKLFDAAQDQAEKMHAEAIQEASEKVAENNIPLEPEEKIHHNKSIFRDMAKTLGFRAQNVLDLAAINVFKLRGASPDIILSHDGKESVQHEASKQFEIPAHILTVEFHNARIRNDGVYYLRDRQTAFVDRGEQVDVNGSQHALAALLYSQRKWGALDIKGTPEFIDKCVRIAAEHNIEIMNPELQERIRLAKEQFAPNEIRQAPTQNPVNEQEQNRRPEQPVEQIDIPIDPKSISPITLSGAEYDDLMQHISNVSPEEMAAANTFDAAQMSAKMGVQVEPPHELELHNGMPFDVYEGEVNWAYELDLGHPLDHSLEINDEQGAGRDMELELKMEMGH